MQKYTAPRERCKFRILRWAMMAVMLIGLPLIGIALAGKPIKPCLEFPPLTRYVRHAPFSGWIFGFFVTVDLLMGFFIAFPLIRFRRQRPAAPSHSHAFPKWGWIGLAIMLGGWLMAWTRFSWFAPLQGYTFCLPWIGYIVFVNALCVRRSGRSLLTDNAGQFVMLILTSALFWWFFEYLNRFVQNWYYVGVDDFSPLAYTLFASLAFATVLPAVLSTYRLLLTLPIFYFGMQYLPGMDPVFPRFLSITALAISCFGLTGLGVWPDLLFALLWISPLLIITALQSLSGDKTIFGTLRYGDWRPVLAAPLAALICGFFWELWNFGSLARWYYSVPYVNRYHLFAMPILGYGGYLPFGLECLVIGAMVIDRGLLFPGFDHKEKDI